MVGKHGLLYKVSKVIKYRNLVNLLEEILVNQSFQVYLCNKGSRLKSVNNRFPQSSILAPTLFNLYIHDILNTEGVKFQFADDIAIAYQSKELKDGNVFLNNDLEFINTYFREWQLMPNPVKTEVCAFHLNNSQDKKKLEVEFGGVRMNHNFCPKYLGITLNRTLKFNVHLSTLSKQIRSV